MKETQIYDTNIVYSDGVEQYVYAECHCIQNGQFLLLDIRHALPSNDSQPTQWSELSTLKIHLDNINYFSMSSFSNRNGGDVEDMSAKPDDLIIRFKGGNEVSFKKVHNSFIDGPLLVLNMSFKTIYIPLKRIVSQEIFNPNLI